MKQIDLFEGIENKKFPKYHEENPHIYESFKRYAFEAIKSGREYFSAEAIINRLRWDSMIKGNDDFKINNDYKPFYSRMFMNEYPIYRGFFKCRKSKFDEGYAV